MAKAMADGDYAKIVDSTYPKMVEAGGGREKMIKMIEEQMKAMKNRGIEITSVTIGDPGEFHTEGDNMFMIIPEKWK